MKRKYFSFETVLIVWRSSKLLVWPTFMETRCFGLQELICGRDVPVLLGGTVKKTETLLKIHAGVF